MDQKRIQELLEAQRQRETEPYGGDLSKAIDQLVRLMSVGDKGSRAHIPTLQQSWSDSPYATYMREKLKNPHYIPYPQLENWQGNFRASMHLNPSTWLSDPDAVEWAFEHENRRYPR